MNTKAFLFSLPMFAVLFLPTPSGKALEMGTTVENVTEVRSEGSLSPQGSNTEVGAQSSLLDNTLGVTQNSDIQIHVGSTAQSESAAASDGEAQAIIGGEGQSHVQARSPLAELIARVKGTFEAMFSLKF